MTNIDFSAQFGGRDAAAVVLPHFKALKAASHGVHLEGCPFPKLAFILRVDGEVNQYELSGSGNLDIGENGKYLSIDIGIKENEREQLVDNISAAMLSSIDLVGLANDTNSWDIDLQALRRCLLDVIVRYKNELSCQRD